MSLCSQVSLWMGFPGIMNSKCQIYIISISALISTDSQNLNIIIDWLINDHYEFDDNKFVITGPAGFSHWHDVTDIYYHLLSLVVQNVMGMAVCLTELTSALVSHVWFVYLFCPWYMRTDAHDLLSPNIGLRTEMLIMFWAVEHTTRGNMLFIVIELGRSCTTSGQIYKSGLYDREKWKVGYGEFVFEEKVNICINTQFSCRKDMEISCLQQGDFLFNFTVNYVEQFSNKRLIQV